MKAEFIPPKDLGTVKAQNSNTLSDQYRDAITLEYSFIGTTVADTTFELDGRTYTSPIMAGPCRRGADPESDIIFARAVQETGTVLWSHYHNREMHARILEEGIPAIRVIKPLRDVNKFIDEVKFDTDNGAVGYSMDLSHGLTDYGELDEQSEGRYYGPMSVDDIAKINDASPLPFYIKDIMSVRDAMIVKEIGLAGLVLSNHNNRFPCCIPMLKLLPEVRKAVGPDMKIFIDGGLNTGYDAFKALALGADAVLCARSYTAAFAKGGAEGLQIKIQEMAAQLKGAMSATCSPDLRHINHDCIILP